MDNKTTLLHSLHASFLTTQAAANNDHLWCTHRILCPQGTDPPSPHLSTFQTHIQPSRQMVQLEPNLQLVLKHLAPAGAVLTAESTVSMLWRGSPGLLGVVCMQELLLHCCSAFCRLRWTTPCPSSAGKRGWSRLCCGAGCCQGAARCVQAWLTSLACAQAHPCL